MSVIVSDLHCPSCGTLIGQLRRPQPVNRYSVGGPHEGLVRQWLAEDDWTGELTSAEVKARFDAWMTGGEGGTGVSQKAIAMGMQAAGLIPRRESRRRLWVR